MKKKVAFQREIEFSTMIGEITAISLEHDLRFVDEVSVCGNLILSGKYKLTEASRLEEDFSYNIPIEIALVDSVDLNTTNVEITDFYYSIKNGNVLDANFELLVEGEEKANEVEEIENLNIEETRECDGDSVVEKEIEIPMIEKNATEQPIENVYTKEVDIASFEEKNGEGNKTNVDSLFIQLDDGDETYGTFLVYIVRQNESINTIIEKYNTSVEELEKYNNLKDLNIGTKLIIPLKNEASN